MTEASESSGVTGAPVEPSGDGIRGPRPSGLNQALAWVGIVAGVVFIVAVIFFSGFVLGTASGHHYGGHHGYYQNGQMGPGQIGPGGMMGPGQMGPGGTMGPGGPTTTSLVPSPPRP